MAEFNQNTIISSNTIEPLRFSVINQSTGLPIPVGDIVGASWGMTALEEEMTPLISKDLISGGIIVPEDGVVLVTILPTDTIGLSGEFTHELRLTDAGGMPRVVSRGRITIKYQVATNPL